MLPLVAAYNSNPYKFVSFLNSVFKRRNKLPLNELTLEIFIGIV
jgi:hypothetical protein